MKVIILCGGMGTRLREETEYKPKPMVEVGGKPILWHIMKQYAHYGFKKFVLALGYKGEIIRDYFINYHNYNNDLTIDLGNDGNILIHKKQDNDDWEVTLADTGIDSMTGFRTKLAGSYIQEDRFMLTYGDAVSNINIKDLMAFSVKQDTIATVTGVFPPSRFGDLTIDGTMVKKFKEKTKDIENQDPINGGYFVFKRNFLDMIPDDPTIDLEKKPMEKLIKMNELAVYHHKDFWHCMDTYRDYLELNKLWVENPLWKIWG